MSQLRQQFQRIIIDETMPRRLRLGHQAQIGDARSPEGRSQPLLGERVIRALPHKAHRPSGHHGRTRRHARLAQQMPQEQADQLLQLQHPAEDQRVAQAALAEMALQRHHQPAGTRVIKIGLHGGGAGHMGAP